MKIKGSAPYFFVSDIQRSVRFYVDVLGFTEPKMWGDPPGFAMPHKDGFVVMLNQEDGKSPRPNGPGEWDAYFWCDEVNRFFEEIKDKCEIAYGPQDQPYYGMREVAVLDPDGHMLVFAADMLEE